MTAVKPPHPGEQGPGALHPAPQPLRRRPALVTGVLVFALLLPLPATAADCVVLLHGLARTGRSMQPLADYLQQQGFEVANLSYPSRREGIEALAPDAIDQGLRLCRVAQGEQIHFVTHSMGGILLRYYLSRYQVPELGRVIMLSPPNQGSEIVDKLGELAVFRWLNGPAGQQLGTGAQSLPLRLRGAHYELGIITGDRSLNPLLSLLIPGRDDGKVAVARARLDGMRDFLIVHSSHTFIMRDPKVLRQVDAFLRDGAFTSPAPLN